MSARDDYPAIAVLHDAWLASGKKQPEAVRAFIEIERLRGIKASDDGAYEHVVEMYHAAREDCETWEATVARLQVIVDERETGIAERREMMNTAVRLATDYGWIDGDHHKAWVIDQMLRALLGDSYGEVVGVDWDEGIAP